MVKKNRRGRSTSSPQDEFANHSKNENGMYLFLSNKRGV